MNLEVQLQGSVLRKPIKVNALLANNCAITYMSRRLANQLGLTEFRSVYVKEIFSGHILKWKISLFPVTLKVTEGTNGTRGGEPIITYTYPLVPGEDQELDLFWEMTIGQDVWETSPGGLFEACGEATRERRATTRGSRKPTPGPAYDPNVHYMGHNLAFVNVIELPKDKNEYIEYDCSGSTAISRLALNKVTRQLVVIYTPSALPTTPPPPSSHQIYQYENLSIQLEQKIEKAICTNDGSLGAIMQEVRDACPFTVVASFPEDAILVNVSTEANR